ncbi:MAG: nitrate/nitrite transporter [Acidimicrobiales bacterium]
MASAKSFRQAGHAPSLLAALLHFDISFMVWVLLGALGAYVAADLDLTSPQKGLMVAVPALGGAGFRLLIGGLADRFGIKRTGLVTLALTLVPLAWAALAGGTYGQVLGIGLLLGVAGASFAVALPLAGYWYPPEYRGLALGIAGAGNSGTLIAALAAPRIAEHVGWHATFGLAAIPVTLAWIGFALLAKEPPRPDAGRPSSSASASLRLLEEPDARWLCAFYLVTFGGFVGLSSYLPIFFVDRFGLAKVSAAGYAALCAAAGSFLRPLGGALADRLGGTRVLSGVLLGVGCLAAALVALPALGATVFLLFLILGGLGACNGAVFQLVPQRFPTRIGTVTGLVGAAGGIGGFVLPFALGSLKGSTGSFASGFVFLAGALFIGSLAVARRHLWWRANDVEMAVA